MKRQAYLACDDHNLEVTLPLLPEFVGIIQRRRTASGGSLDNAGPIVEAGVEEHIGVGEEALFERDNNELGTTETRAEEHADVLHVE